MMDFGADADDMFGNSGDDDLSGRTGHDRLAGEIGDDITIGDIGDDATDGGLGDDRLWGDARTNSMFGGSGGDLFVYSPGSGRDAAADFSGTSGDRLILSTGLWSGPMTATQVNYQFGSFDDVGLTLQFAGDDTVRLHGLTDRVMADVWINIA